MCTVLCVHIKPSFFSRKHKAKFFFLFFIILLFYYFLFFSLWLVLHNDNKLFAPTLLMISREHSLQYGAFDWWGTRDCAPWSRKYFIADATNKSSINRHMEWQGEISSSNNRFNFYKVSLTFRKFFQSQSHHIHWSTHTKSLTMSILNFHEQWILKYNIFFYSINM